MRTVLEVLNLSIDYLEKRGAGSPRIDAQYLLAELLGMSRTELYMNARRPMVEDEIQAYRELIRRRGTGEPVAYILGEREFWSLAFNVSPDVLVPRPETEHLVEAVINEVKRAELEAPRIVDVGTGSGCIAVSLATELPAAKILALDISADALTVAESNAERHGVRERVAFRAGDLLGPLAGRSGVVDIVVSNPPYIAHWERAQLSTDVKDHEPGLALFADDDGLALIRTLVAQARGVLTEDGVLFMEFGATQGAAVKAIAEAHFADVEVFKDYSGHDRWVRAGVRLPVRDAEQMARG